MCRVCVAVVRNQKTHTHTHTHTHTRTHTYTHTQTHVRTHTHIQDTQTYLLSCSCPAFTQMILFFFHMLHILNGSHPPPCAARARRRRQITKSALGEATARPFRNVFPGRVHRQRSKYEICGSAGVGNMPTVVVMDVSASMLRLADPAEPSTTRQDVAQRGILHLLQYLEQWHEFEPVCMVSMSSSCQVRAPPCLCRV